MRHTLLQNSMFWILSASILGFGISAAFSGWLKLSRNIFLIPYIVLSTLFLLAYFSLNENVSREFWVHNLSWGIVAVIIAGGFLMKNILSQPLSQSKHGIQLWGEIIWAGIAYGIIDGLLLNVFPVVAVWNIFSLTELTGNIQGEIFKGLSALLASLVITLFYHIGYTEFRNKSVLLVLLGNTIITLTFVISGNPVAAVVCHTTMHVAAVIRGPETTLQLPPHYQVSKIAGA